MISWSILYVLSHDSSLGWYLPWPRWCDTPLSSLMTSDAYLIITTHLSIHFLFGEHFPLSRHFHRASHNYHAPTPSHDCHEWYLNPCFQCMKSVEMFSRDISFMILGNNFKIWKFNTNALRKFSSSYQMMACPKNLMLWEISGLKFPQSHPKFALRSSKVVDFTGILWNLLHILIFIGDLCSSFGFLSLQGSMGSIFRFL